MENEKRFIDADEFAKCLERMTKTAYPNLFPGLLEAIDFAKDFISSDVVEVVHGRWEDEYGGKYANPRYRCSICKERALYKFERDLLDNWKGVQALTPACPYCMAKLDGGIENDI